MVRFASRAVLAAALLFCGLSTGREAAAALSDQEAVAIATDILETLTDQGWKDASTSTVQAIEVKRQNGSYLVVFDRTKLNLDELGSLQLSGLALSFSPAKNGDYTFSTMMPPVSEHLDQNGASQGRLTIKDSKISGVFMPAAKRVRSTEMNVQGLTYAANEGIGKGGGWSLKAADFKQEWNQKDQGLWSGYGSGTLKGVSGYEPESGLQVTLKSAKFDSSVIDIDLDAWEKIAKEVDPKRRKGKQPLRPEEVERLSNEIGDLELNAGSGGFELAGLRFFLQGKPMFSLGSGAFKLAYDARKERGSFAWLMEADKIATKPGDLPASLSPTATTLAFGINGLPWKELVRLALPAAASLSPENGDQQEPIDQDILRGIIERAAPVVVLKKLLFETTTLKAEANGKLSTDPSLPRGASLQVDVRIGGIDKTIAALATLPPDHEVAQGAMTFLNVAKVLGSPEQGADPNNPIYEFRLEGSPDSGLMLNGRPLNGLLPKKTAY